jgi:hypothetical protein
MHSIKTADCGSGKQYNIVVDTACLVVGKEEL